MKTGDVTVAVPILLSVVSLLAPLSAAAAQSFDNAATHQQARYGALTCFVTHPHAGESPSWGSREGAVKAAIRQWSNFTTFEYGAKWGNYALARNKSMDCSQSGSRWVCKTIAYPCRR